MTHGATILRRTAVVIGFHLLYNGSRHSCDDAGGQKHVGQHRSECRVTSPFEQFVFTGPFRNQFSCCAFMRVAKRPPDPAICSGTDAARVLCKVFIKYLSSQVTLCGDRLRSGRTAILPIGLISAPTCASRGVYENHIQRMFFCSLLSRRCPGHRGLSAWYGSHIQAYKTRSSKAAIKMSKLIVSQ